MATELIAPEPGWLWVHAPLRGELRGTICGEVQCYQTHWYCPSGSKRARPVRCVRREVGACAWCDAHHERRVRYVVPLLTDQGVRLIELGRAVYSVLAMIREAGTEIGRNVVISRERAERNAPVLMVPGGQSIVGAAQRVDIGPYVHELGREALVLLDVPAVAAPFRER